MSLCENNERSKVIEETKVRCNDRSSSRSIVGARNRRNDFEKLSFYFYMKALSRSLTPSQSIEFCTLRFLLRCEKSRKVQPLWFFQRFIPWRIHAWKALVATHLTNCQIVLSKECSSWKLAYYLLGHDNDHTRQLLLPPTRSPIFSCFFPFPPFVSQNRVSCSTTHEFLANVNARKEKGRKAGARWCLPLLEFNWIQLNSTELTSSEIVLIFYKVPCKVFVGKNARYRFRQNFPSLSFGFPEIIHF